MTFYRKQSPRTGPCIGDGSHSSLVTDVGRADMPKKKYVLISLFVFSIIFAAFYGPHRVQGTVEFTCETGFSCIHCHENPEGGDTLTPQGEAFIAAGYVLDRSVKPSGWPVFVKLVCSFLHLLAAVIWFGAIFYIHIFVKPASLTGGLPRNERILGWVCIVVVGVTGIILTIYRVRSVEALWTTTFGIVWLVKVAFFMIMVLIAAVATTVLNRRMRTSQNRASKGGLTGYDGRQGRPGYFAFEGDLYDVGQSKMWKNGVHMGRHYCGTDLSAAMADAPHGTEVLEKVKKVGPEASQGMEKKRPAARVFVFMAYFILFCVLIVIFCVAYWNWGPSLVGR